MCLEINGFRNSLLLILSLSLPLSLFFFPLPPPLVILFLLKFSIGLVLDQWPKQRNDTMKQNLSKHK